MRRNKEEADETRRAILVAAEKLFIQKGVARVSLAQIAETLGLTRGAVRWHFYDKRGLLLALLESRGHPLQEFVRYPETEQTLDPLDELAKLAACILRELQSDPQRGRLLQQLQAFADAEAPDQRRTLDRKLRGAIQAVLEIASRRGELAAEWRPDQAALAFHVLVTGLTSEWLRGGAEFSLCADVVSLIRAFVVSLRAKTTGGE